MKDSFFGTLAQNLLNLEINTIIKSEMSACKMPARRIALYQLARWYDKKLKELKVRGDVYWKYAGLNSFGELRDRAQEGILKLADEAPGENIEMLERIQDQSSQIASMFKTISGKARDQTKKGYADAPDPTEAVKELQAKGVDGEELQKQLAIKGIESEMWNNDIDRDEMAKIEDLDLTPDQITLIRKAWDIGTERILLQTVIQLDGDVTTRMSEDFSRCPNETILKIHNDSIVTSTGFWAGLVNVLIQIVGKTFDLTVRK